MERKYNLTEGNILGTLTGFAVPVFFTLFLQALYGGIDLLVVGKFAETEDVSGVATGSMLLSTVTMIITGLSMGITILVGEKTGMRKSDEAGKAIGSGICLFAVSAALMTVITTAGSGFLTGILNAPAEAVSQTSSYILICGAGSVFIVAYNVLGAIFRGIGDSRTPLMTVAIACVVNIAGDLLLVAVFNMGAAGAALATVAAQAVSVVISFIVITKRKNLPFEFSKDYIKFNKKIIGTELKLGIPVALQELLVGISFLVIQTIVNSFGVTASAGVGVAEKVCVFNAGSISVYAVNVGLCSSEYGRMQSGKGQESAEIWHYDCLCCRTCNVLHNFLPRRSVVMDIFQGRRHHSGIAELSESLCDRLPAYAVSVLLHGLL